MSGLLKRILALCLCFFLLSGGALAQTTKATVTVLSVTERENTLEITCHIQGEAEGISCLIYSLDSTGAPDTLLQVQEYAGAVDAVATVILPVTHSPHGYRVCVGGDNVAAFREITMLSREYTFPYLPFVSGQTAGEVKGCMESLGEVALLRQEQPLEDSQTVTPGDVVAAARGQYTLVRFGDVDADGKISAKDALQILRHAVKKITLTGTAFAAANWGQDNKVDAADALAVLKFAVGKLEYL